jgi:hypothetical protein
MSATSAAVEGFKPEDPQNVFTNRGMMQVTSDEFDRLWKEDQAKVYKGIADMTAYYTDQ